MVKKDRNKDSEEPSTNVNILKFSRVLTSQEAKELEKEVEEGRALSRMRVKRHAEM